MSVLTRAATVVEINCHRLARCLPKQGLLCASLYLVCNLFSPPLSSSLAMNAGSSSLLASSPCPHDMHISLILEKSFLWSCYSLKLPPSVFLHFISKYLKKHAHPHCLLPHRPLLDFHSSVDTTVPPSRHTCPWAALILLSKTPWHTAFIGFQSHCRILVPLLAVWF